MLISTYCQSLGDGEDCLDVPEVREAVVRYEERLGVNCYSMGREEEDNIVLVVKGKEFFPSPLITVTSKI